MNIVTIRHKRPSEPYPMDLLLLADPDEQVIRTYMERSLCYILELNTQASGVYILLQQDQTTAEIMNIAVREELQGKGLGLQLLRHAVSESEKLGCNRINIATGNSSIGQLYLYQKAGFRIIGVEADYFTNHYENPIYENGLQCRDRILLSQKLMV